MKKTKQIIGLIAILSFIILLSNTSLAAKGSFSLSKSSVTLTEGSSTTFKINVSNSEGKFTISSSDSSVVTVSNTSEWIDSNGKTITLTAKKKGKATITVTAAEVADTNENEITGSKSIAVTVNEKTTGGSNSGSSSGSSSSGSGSSGSNTTKIPTFKSTNQKVYTTGDCNLRSSWSTSSSATPISKDTELTLTGTSTETVNGYTWYRVTYQGSTKYVASSLITYNKPDNKDKNDDKDDNKNEKSSNKNLSSLKIEGIDMTPSFSKDTTQYTAHVDGDVDELKINAKAEDSNAKVAIEGNKGLKEGDNIIKVKVTAEDETTRTYFITVTKGEGTEIDTGLKLSELIIERVDFESTFKPDVYSYDLDLTSYVEKLDITATPSQADATVEISGNEDFKEGENVIIILLTSADGNETATYQIKVNVPAEVIEKAEEEENISLYILIGIAVAVVLIAIIVVVRRHRANREDDYEEEFLEDDDIKIRSDKQDGIGGRRFASYENEEQLEEEEEQEERKTRGSRNATLDEFFNAQDDEEDGPRRPRGRHSR